MEIEAKLKVADADTLQRLRSLKHLACFDVLPGRTCEVHDTYLDSPDRRMLAAGLSCRLRRQDDAARITLKGLGGSDGAVHRRAEQEILLPQGTPHAPYAWPDTALRQQVLHWIGNAPLVALVDLHQTRTERTVVRDGLPVAMLSLDHVLVAASGRRDEYWELEIELLPTGSEGDLAAMVAALGRDWELTPQPRSKFERGLALPEAWTGKREQS